MAIIPTRRSHRATPAMRSATCRRNLNPILSRILNLIRKTERRLLPSISTRRDGTQSKGACGDFLVFVFCSGTLHTVCFEFDNVLVQFMVF